MTVFIKTIAANVVLLVLCILPVSNLLYAQNEALDSSETKQEKPIEIPDLVDIIPLAENLADRLRVVKTTVPGLIEKDAVLEQYAALSVKTEDLALQLEQLKVLEEYKYNKIVALRDKVKENEKQYDEISKPTNGAIRKLSSLKKEWLTEKSRWSHFEKSLLTGEEYDRLKPTFVKAESSINTALDIVLSNLDIIFAIQEKGSTVNEKINELNSELDSLLTVERRAAILEESLPILSKGFFYQLRDREMWNAAIKGVRDTLQPGGEYLASRGWIPLLQLFIFLSISVTIRRNKVSLNESERWSFLSARPFSAGFFLSFMMTALVYEYQGVPATWKLVNTIFAGLSFAIFMGSLMKIPWRKHFVQGVMCVLVITRTLDVLNFPLSIYRLYIVLAAGLGVICCLHLAKTSLRENESRIYPWSLRFLSLFLGIVILAEFWSNRSLASYLFVSMIQSIADIFIFTMFMYMIRGAMEWLFRLSPLKRFTVMHEDDTEVIIRLMAHFIDLLIFVLVFIPDILVIWGLYDNLETATTSLLALGFNLGEQRITVGLVLAALSVIYLSFLVSWIVQNMLLNEELFKRRGVLGVRLSMARLVHYAIMVVGLLLAISVLGLKMGEITIMLSALGVGIGFGLQGLANNFVSGLILLFERPVRVGDIIEIGGNWAEIKKIGLRATTVLSMDQADVIIPNGELVATQVTNWTLSNRHARLIIQVGVAYGSDVPLVIDTLVASAKMHTGVVQKRQPQVLFQNFGESSLEFELRVWVLDADDRFSVGSDLRQEIDKRFREVGIEISFPQRDLHLRSVDQSISVPIG